MQRDRVVMQRDPGVMRRDSVVMQRGSGVMRRGTEVATRAVFAVVPRRSHRTGAERIVGDSSMLLPLLDSAFRIPHFLPPALMSARSWHVC
jgi:hypothetical protein